MRSSFFSIYYLHLITQNSNYILYFLAETRRKGTKLLIFQIYLSKFQFNFSFNLISALRVFARDLLRLFEGWHLSPFRDNLFQIPFRILQSLFNSSRILTSCSCKEWLSATATLDMFTQFAHNRASI